MNSERRIVIVGAGQAGGRLAQALRRAGHAGPIALIGQESRPPYERPPLSKDILLGMVTHGSLQLLDDAGWSALNVSLCCNSCVSEIDRAHRRVLFAQGGEPLPYDVLVLATGARARAFPGRIAPGTELHYLRTIDDALQLRSALGPGRRLSVIGAGFIGLELAASARQLGAEVSLIESAPRPLARLLPQGVADWLTQLHREHGATLRLATQIESVAPGRIHLTDGQTLVSDVIAVGIGAVPNDELAQAAGLAVRDGIVVDGDGRSTDPSIYALGDVARHVDASRAIDVRLESWRNAEDQAVTVAATICGMEPPARSVPWFWTDQYGRNIQLAGRPLDGEVVVQRGRFEDGPGLAYYLAGGVVRGVVGVDCGRDLRAAQRLIRDATTVDVNTLPGPKPKARGVHVPG